MDDNIDATIQQLATVGKLDPRILTNFVKNADDPWPKPAEIVGYLTPADQKTVSALDAEMDRLQAQIVPRAMIVAVTDQATPTDEPIHLRGGVDSISANRIPRGTLRLFDDAVPRPIIAPTESGRLELAKWITDPRNPLAARVMANRIWQWHFGRGIVETPSDFGSRGSPPTNPQLLDWLASSFMREGWSIKKLHRQIMLSSTYRMSGQANPEAVAADPENSNLSRFSPRRLEAEELFDSMFSSTNILIRQESGSPLDLQKSLGRGMYVLTTNRAPPGLGAEVRKMLTLFDLDMTGATIDRRPQSNTAAQSLFWLNSPLPKYYAGKFAERLLKMDKLTDEKRLDQAYLIAFGHPPDKEMSRVTLDYLSKLQSEGLSQKDAWAKVCQAIYASDEFHYVE